MYGCFVGMSVCLSVQPNSLVPMEGRRCLVTWNWNYRWLQATAWVLGIEPCPLEEQSLLLTQKPS